MKHYFFWAAIVFHILVSDSFAREVGYVVSDDGSVKCLDPKRPDFEVRIKKYSDQKVSILVGKKEIVLPGCLAEEFKEPLSKTIRGHGPGGNGQIEEISYIDLEVGHKGIKKKIKLDLGLGLKEYYFDGQEGLTLHLDLMNGWLSSFVTERIGKLKDLQNSSEVIRHHQEALKKGQGVCSLEKLTFPIIGK